MSHQLVLILEPKEQLLVIQFCIIYFAPMVILAYLSFLKIFTHYFSKPTETIYWGEPKPHLGKTYTKSDKE